MAKLYDVGSVIDKTAARKIYGAAVIDAQENGGTLPPFEMWWETEKAKARAAESLVKRAK